MTELRSTTVDLKATTRDDQGTTKKTIQGYAVTFDTLSVDLGGFIETISPKALDGVDLSSVRLIYAHEKNSILARADSGTGNLQMTVDSKGLFFVAELADTTLANDVYANIQAGNLKGMSFGFTIPSGGDSWSRQPDGTLLHEVDQIGEVGELTVTAWPAYPETSVELKRSAEQQSTKGNSTQMATDNTAPADAQAPAQDAPASSDDVLTKIGNTLDQVLSRLTALEQDEAQEEAEDEAEDAEDVAEDEAEATPAERDDVPDVPAVEEASAEPSAPVAPKAPVAPEQEPAPVEDNKGDQKMATVVTPAKNNERADFHAFLKRDFPSIVGGTVSPDNSVALPHDILTPIEKPANTNSLIALANVQPVSAPSGDIPVMGATNVTLNTVEELQLNPQIAKLQLETVSYKLSTKRGFLPVSQELLDQADSAVGIDKLIGDYASQIRDNTLVAAIAGVLKQASTSTATSFDDVKKAYNSLFKYNNKSFVVTKSAFDALDTLKDGRGRYLLQDSITAASGKQILGAPVYVVEDTVLGTKDGDQVVFVGDVHSFAFVPTFKDLRVKWTDSDIYGQKLQLVLSNDAVLTNADAGQLIKLALVAPTAPAAG